MRRTSLLILATFLASLQSLGAQQPGEPVRLTIEGPSSQRLAGVLVGQDPDSFWVQIAGRAAPASVARRAVVRLEVSRGHKRAVGEGALFGAGLGALGGFVRGGVTASRSQSCRIPDIFGSCYLDWYGRAFRGGLIGGAIGGIVGAALGYAARTERWEGVPLSRAHHLALAPRGAGLALSLTL